jgi:hypothetical protein
MMIGAFQEIIRLATPESLGGAALDREASFGEVAVSGAEAAALLAEPAETAHQRGPKKRAKTDKADARHLRTLVAEGRVAVSWIPPGQVRELRVLLQLYRDLREEHTAWAQRIDATLLHQGVPGLAGRLAGPQARALHVDLRPVQSGGPPVYLGGFSDAALHRIGRRAAGWLTIGRLPAKVATECWDNICRSAERAGRDPDALRRIVRLNPQEGDDVAGLATTLETHAGRGAHEAFVDLTFLGGDVDHSLDIAARLASSLGLQAESIDA